MKTCTGCGLQKELEDYYYDKKKLYHFARCKECTKEHVRANRAKRIDYYREYDLMRWDRDGKRGEASKEAKLRGGRAWAERNMEKRDAYAKVWSAIRSGKLTKQPCEVCGSDTDVEAHHEDYSKPLDVHWLCTEHHGETRRKERDPNFQPVRAKKAA